MARPAFLLRAAALAAAFLAAANAHAAEQLKPGDAFRDCTLCPEMVVVPAGSYIMGSNGRHKWERPAHKVTFTRPFAVGRYEVTFDEWQACFDAGGCARMPHDHEWGYADRPVINITFAEAETYTAWLTKETGHVYRLPSEAEWEYIARAGTTTEFWWGEKVGVNRANCRDCGSKWSMRGSGPVGSFPANPFGLHDTAGNVWEWIADCWNANYVGAPADGSPRRDGKCRRRVMRSGSWYYFSKNSRSAWRAKNDGRVKSYNIGMRVLRELP